MNDQEGVILAGDYDITNWGLDPLEVKSIYVFNPATGKYDIEIKKPTQEQINQLAEFKLKDKFGNKFTIVDSVHDEKTGLDAIIITNKNGEQFVIFQGSQWTHGGEDWLGANLSLANNEIHAQHLAALEQINEWMETYNIKGVAGNSLAGGLVQLIVMANPELYGVATNPAGVNDAMVQYLMKKYNLTEEMLQNMNIKNFYTDTDILHKLLGLEAEDEIKAFNEKYPYLSQIGQQIFHQGAGDFSLDNMGVEHTGNDRVTIYGPFDPLTGNFIISDTVKMNGFTHYLTQPTTTIALNVEELVNMATKLSYSLDAHDDEMVIYFRNLSEILEHSSGDMTRREAKVENSLEDLIHSRIISSLGVTGPDWIAKIALQHMTGGIVDQEVRDAIRNVKIDILDVTEDFKTTIKTFLNACNIQIEMHENRIKVDGAGNAIRVPYYTDNFLGKPVEEALAKYIETRANEAAYIHGALHYYARAILHAASVFAQTDEALAKTISETAARVDNYGLTSQDRNDIMNPPVMNLFPVDETSFAGGLVATKKKIMDDNMKIFEKFFSDTIIKIRDHTLGEALAIVNGLKREPVTNPSFQHILTQGIDRSDSNYDYEAYNRACAWATENQRIAEKNTSLDDVVAKLKQAQSVLGNLGVQEVIVDQFKNQILHVLFADTEMYELINNAQRIAAHSSIAALLISQANSNLSYNSGKTIDAMKTIGDKVQMMLEIQMEHMQRIKV